MPGLMGSRGLMAAPSSPDPIVPADGTQNVTGDLTVSGVIRSGAGAVGGTGIQVGDADTGLYLGGANQLSVAAGGAAVVHFINGAVLASGGASLGFPGGSEWGPTYFSSAEFWTTALTPKGTSVSVGAGERYTLWDGSNLTATLPADPTGGCILTLKNLNATALTVAAGSGDNMLASDDVSLAQFESATYIFRDADDTWYRIG